MIKWEKGESSEIHWCLLLTLGRTPVTPANRHKKNLKETIRVCEHPFQGAMIYHGDCDTRVDMNVMFQLGSFQPHWYRFHSQWGSNQLQLCTDKGGMVKASSGHWLFRLTAVGVIYHHASAEARFHGLCCDQLQLERGGKVTVSKRILIKMCFYYRRCVTCSEFSG